MLRVLRGGGKVGGTFVISLVRHLVWGLGRLASWLLLAVVVNGPLPCHNERCKAPIYCAACPGSPPDAGLPMTRAHPPEARVIIYFHLV